MRIVLAITQALAVTAMLTAITEQADKARAWALTLLLTSSTGLYFAVTGDQTSATTYVLVSLVALNGLADAKRQSEGGL